MRSLFKPYYPIVLASILVFFTVAIGTVQGDLTKEKERLVSSHSISLEQRYANRFVNSVFKDNILLNLAYMRGLVSKASQIDWEKVKQPFTYEVTLQPGDVFAFHEDILPEYYGKSVVTTNAHFNAQDGFLTSGYLYGDGVCHFASLVYWVGKDAGLNVKAPTNHNFARIPEVPSEYGASIYFMPGNPRANSLQNIYIENNKESAMTLKFDFDGEHLTVSVII